MSSTEEDKRITDSVERFYEFNHIQSERYASSQREAYMQNKPYDPQIVREGLETRISHWIERFDENERDYFYSLFENYHYISEQEYKYRIWQLCEAIYADLQEKQIDRTQVLFVTIPSPKGVGSGGDSLRSQLLCVNQEWGMDKDQIISDIEKMDPALLKDKKAIVFIDDILGTGFSVRGTIEKFQEHCAEENLSNCLIYVTGILMTKRAEKYIAHKTEKRVRVFRQQEEKNRIRNCMTGGYIFDEKEKQKIEKIIEKYEKEIGMEEEKSYVMGFGGCRILLSFYYNTPNNTLCSFWKCTEKNIPPFPRGRNKRLALETIQARKQKLTENAYLKGCLDAHENA